MYRDALPESSLFPILLSLDHQNAAEVARRGCPFCSGKLHRGDYPRKPRGGPEEPQYRRRVSFCCAQEGCRRRVTPPSVLFLGRKVHFAAVVVLVSSCLVSGPRPARVAHLARETGLSARTLRRWLRWWRRDFVLHEAWRARQGLWRQPVDVTQLPRSLLACFQGQGSEPLVALLRFLGPWTTTSESHGF